MQKLILVSHLTKHRSFFTIILNPQKWKTPRGIVPIIPGQARSSLSSLSCPGAKWLKRSRCSSSPARSGIEPVSCISPASIVRRRMMDTTNSGRRTPVKYNSNKNTSTPKCHITLSYMSITQHDKKAITCQISFNNTGDFSKVAATS